MHTTSAGTLRGPSTGNSRLHFLDAFGIPAARLDARGRVLSVSSSAPELLGVRLSSMLQQATWLVSELAAARVGHGPDGATRSVPSADGRIMVRAQLLPASEEEGYAVVLFLPVYARDAGGPPPCWGLSERESQVAREIALGASSKAIAAALGISLHTVRRHTERVFAKLGVQSRSQVVRLLAEVPPPVG